MENCRVRKLINCRNVIPEDVYNRFVALASDEDLWEGTVYSWDKTAYVVEEEIESTQTKGPFVTSQWSQWAPYSASGEPLGCVTIAVGQLMRYHKFPNQFNWYGMYNVGYSRFTQAFLSELRAELNVDDNGGSNINEAKKTLEKYGYNVTQMPHNIQTVHNELNSMRPVYTRGNELNDTKNGHAWIIDGYKFKEYIKKYTLYRLADYHYPEFVYVEAEPNGNWVDYYYTKSFYHMNWGWSGGTHNGYFLDENISVDGDILTGENRRVNLSHDRQDLLVRKP